MSNKQHFHPLALLIHFSELVKGFIFFFLIIGFKLADSGYVFLALGALIFVLALLAFTSYWFTYYQVTEEHILINKGIFNKKETIIPYNRIQTIKQRQWFFFKPFHLVHLSIETAGGSSDSAEASMPAVSESMLHLIENYRKHDNHVLTETALDEKDTTKSTSYQVTSQHIFVFSLTDLGALTALFTAFIYAQERLPEAWFDKLAESSQVFFKMSWLLITALAIVLIILTALVSLIKNLIRYHHFTVTREATTLTIESGLFERKTQKIPLSKIQGITIKQQLLRKVFGLATVELLLAGGQDSEDSQTHSHKLYLLPIIKDEETFGTLEQLLPEWHFTKPEITYTSRHYLWYFWRIPLIIGVLVIPVVTYFHLLAGLVATLLFLLLGLVHTFLTCRNQGYAIQSNERLCFQHYELLTKVQTFVEKQKVQAFSKSTSKWLFKKHIGHFNLWLKTDTTSTKVALRFIEGKELEVLEKYYRN